MNIVKLACKSCGAPLQIRESIDQLACAFCGASMLVDREGGAVSLQIIEAVSAIRTGAEQTAAELALRRLDEEQRNCRGTIAQLRSLDLENRYASADILGDRDLADVRARITALQSKAESLNGVLLGAMAVWGAAFLGAVIWSWSTHDGFFEVIGAILQSGFIIFCLGAVGMAVFAGISTAVASNPDKKLSIEKEKISRHEIAVSLREQLAQLEAARTHLAVIETEIGRNMSIVRK